MQTSPPRYRHATPEELADADFPVAEREPRKPVRRKKVSVRRTEVAEPVFDITRWRLPNRWRNDKKVGDSVIGKMLRGVDLDRYEELANA
jgi:hypothetical protein